MVCVCAGRPRTESRSTFHMRAIERTKPTARIALIWFTWLMADTQATHVPGTRQLDFPCFVQEREDLDVLLAHVGSAPGEGLGQPDAPHIRARISRSSLPSSPMTSTARSAIFL